MDDEWAVETITRFIDLLHEKEKLEVAQVRVIYASGQVNSDQLLDGLRTEMNNMRPVIEAIASRVDPEFLSEIVEVLDYTNHSAIGPCERLRGALLCEESGVSVQPVRNFRTPRHRGVGGRVVRRCICAPAAYSTSLRSPGSGIRQRYTPPV